MVATILNEDLERNIPDAEDCAEWASDYGATHPILADIQGFSDAAMADGVGYPYYMLIDRGMVVTTLDEGTRSISEDEMQELL